MHDQRTNRKTGIGGVDKEVINQLPKKEKRKQAENMLENVNDSFENVAKEVGQSSQANPSETINSPTTVYNTSQMRLSLKSTALVSDRFGVSYRATAALASSVLFDLGIILESKRHLKK